MTLWLSIRVRFLNGRYHGRDGNTRPEWPPTPLRLFQAVVAGALSGRWAVEDRAETEEALRWWEALSAPSLMLAPACARLLQPYRLSVLNNQADRHISKLLAGQRLEKLQRGKKGDAELKHVTPRLVGRQPLIYAWELSDSERERAEALRPVVRRLTALGHGIDHAIADAAFTETRPDSPGSVSYPAGVSPCPGTLDTLISRHFATLARLAEGGLNEALPPIRSTPATRALPATVLVLFTLRQADEDGFAPVDPLLTAVLAHAVRSRLAERLRKAVEVAARRTARANATRATFSAEDVERFVIGRSAAPADACRRPLFLPLPSVGHEYADGLLRRLLIAVPGGCPVNPQTIRNALIDQQISLDGAGMVRLEAAEPDAVSEAYLPKRPTKVWETVSPVLVSGKGARARRPAADDEAAAAKAARLERRWRERIADLVGRALAYSGRDPAGATFELRREPWAARQPRADAAWRTPQNDDGVNWLAGRLGLHLRLTLREPASGPLVIGDGRYLGLGLMAPVRDAWRDVLIFAVPREARIGIADGRALLHAARRALMALSRDERGNVPRLFSGHEPDGGSASSGRHEHIFLAADDSDADGLIDRFMVAAPWACDRSVRPKRGERKLFDETVSRLETVRAGRLGVIALGAPASLAGDDPLIRPTRLWESRTSYVATRHAGRRKNTDESLIRDIIGECVRRGLPRPEVEILEHSGIANGGGLAARVRMRFAVAVRGPLFLGRNSHSGGGVFGTSQ